MAEFADVMRQAKRMCDNCGCGECQLNNGEVCRLGTDHDGEDYSDVERIIMAWASEHPEPRYPTWNEWQHSMFPDASEKMIPCSFASMDKLGCAGFRCKECREQPIPADIADKLGIKHITTAKVVPAHDGCEGCRWMDKDEDEEPCKNCCGVMGRGGSAPDLWEER